MGPVSPFPSHPTCLQVGKGGQLQATGQSLEESIHLFNQSLYSFRHSSRMQELQVHSQRLSYRSLWAEKSGKQKSLVDLTQDLSGSPAPGRGLRRQQPLRWRGHWSRYSGGTGMSPPVPPRARSPWLSGRAELVAASASLSVLGKSFTEMSLGFYFKGSSGKDLLIA